MTAKVSQPTARFAAKLHPKLGKSTENSFYSPFSLLSALGMCSAGAKNSTAESLNALLESPIDPSESKKYFKSLVSEVTGDGTKRDYELVTANALWVQQSLALNEDYQQTVKSDYGGQLVEVNYESNPDDAVEKINGWCNDNTRGKIPTIITKEFINPDTLLILTNAIYFKGKWEIAFNKSDTTDKPFRSPNGEKKVPTMYQSESFRYGENQQFQTLELNYQGDDLSMLLLLPREDTTDNIDSDLEGAYNRAVNDLGYEEKVNVSLPRFKMETKYNLSQTLKEIGVGIAFSDKADFSGITKQEDLKISQVIHKAFVQCDEEGTEAAAATAVGMMRCTSVMMPKPPKVFNADHPFVFFIRNKNSGNVLFAGRVTNPS